MRCACSIESMDKDAAVAEQTLLRHQLHTLRERFHLAERRIHDLEMAQYHGSVRGDAQADAITDLKTMFAGMRADLDALKEP